MTDLPPALPKPERRVRHGLIEDWRDGVGILLLLLVAAFMGALIPRFLPDTDENKADTELTGRVAALESRLAKDGPQGVVALKDRVAKLEAKQKTLEVAMAAGSVGGSFVGLGTTLAPSIGTTPIPPLGTALDPARKQATDLAARLAALEAKTSTTPDDIKAAKEALSKLSATLTAVDIRLAKLENSDLIELARRASLATAVANLTRAAQGSSPFKTEFDVVAAMLPGDKRLPDIAPLAAKGLRTTGTLTAIFGNTAAVALDAERKSKAQGTWEQLLAGFSALISARSTGEIKGNSTEARLSRAETRMKAGDLEAAVKELSAVRGAAREPLLEWLAEAKARVQLEKTLAEVNTEAITNLTGPISDEPVPQLPTP